MARKSKADRLVGQFAALANSLTQEAQMAAHLAIMGTADADINLAEAREVIKSTREALDFHVRMLDLIEAD